MSVRRSTSLYRVAMTAQAMSAPLCYERAKGHALNLHAEHIYEEA